MKIEVTYDIVTPFVVDDTGYTRSMTLPQIEKWARDHMSSVQVFLQEGAGEAKRVPARFSLKGIRFVPDDQK